MKINFALFLALCLSLLSPNARGQSAPIVATLPASDVYAATATLNGTVNPDGGATQVYFEYGTTTAYGSVTATKTLAAGNASLNVSNVLSGLTPDTTYYYQLMASNSFGANSGGQLQFTTGSLLVVTTNADDGGAGTLRTIIANAASSDSIIFDPSLVGETILLTNGLILLTTDLSIDASALSGGIVIDGDANDAIFRVTDPETVVFSALTLTNGFNWGGDGGGAIDNANGILTLNQCILSGNTSTTADGGGAIVNSYGSMTLNQCTVIGNYASEGAGGGIYNLQATLALNQCTVSGNSSDTNSGSGGGIFSGLGTVTLNQCTVCGNLTGGGEGGGGIASFISTLTLVQCTVSGNLATNGSGGGGIFGLDDTENITNSIVAGNDAVSLGSGDMDDSSSLSINYGGTNIIESFSKLGFSGSTPIEADPMLGALANNGGPTQTMLPMVGSPAIDGGDDSATNSFTTDQRGYPIPSGLHVDIGAVEVQQVTVTTLAASGIDGTNATGNGIVTPNDLNAQWGFRYGGDTNYGISTGLTSLGSGFSPVNVSNVFTGLVPDTTYHYQIMANDGVSAKYGADMTFTTPDDAPSASTTTPAYFTTSATLTASVNPDGADTQYYFEYGSTTNYGSFTATNTIPAGNIPVTVSADITGLTPGQTYYYQVVTSNSLGTNEGGQTSFTTGSILVVTTNADDGSAGTLRTVVANAASGDDVTFTNTLAGATILLTNGQITLNNMLAIDASSLPGGIVIDGNSNGRVFQVDGSSILTSLTIRNGFTNSSQGAGILNYGPLTLNQCIVSGNTITNGQGAGIYNAGSMRLNQCTVSGNAGPLNCQGVGIYNGGTMTLNQCTISGNQNATNGQGTGIYNASSMTVNQCTISGNTNPDGQGGGIYNLSTLVLNQSTVAGNSAQEGGGLFDTTTAYITNSILAGNSSEAADAADIFVLGSLTYGGSNIVESISSIGTVTGTAPITSDPELQPLGNYGGPTETMLPLPASPAIDAGSDSAASAFTTDQRGYPRLSGLHVDIGAVEAQQAVVTTLSASAITGTNAVGNGTVTPNDFQTTWSFVYGTTINYGSSTIATSVAAGFSLVDVSNVLGSLAPATTYHYQIQADDGVSIKTGADISFNTLDTAPSVVTGAAINVSAFAATFTGTVNANGAATQYYFQYGTSTNLTFFAVTNTLAAGNTTSNVSDTALELTPATTYYYQLVASNNLGVVFGLQTNFTTPPLPPVPVTLPATGISATNATLSGSISTGYAITGWYFQYGPTTSYGSFTPTNTVPAGGPAVTVSNVIGGLLPGSTYYYQIVATNSVGTNAGGQSNFTTLSVAPVAITEGATNIGATNATLGGLINPGGAVTAYYFQYGPTTNYGLFTATNVLAAGDATMGVSNMVDSLSPGLAYYYQIVATNVVGTDAGLQTNFTTLAAIPVAITEAATGIGSTNATLNGSINPEGAATTYYFQYGLTPNFGLFTATNTVPAGQSAVGVSNALSSLTPSATYYYHLVAGNSVGTATGATLTLTNLKPSLIISDSQIVVAINSPADKFSTTNSTVVIKGTIKGSVATPQLEVVVNTNAPVLVTNVTTTRGTISWTYTAPLTLGPNIITAETIGTNQIQVDSVPATITVFYATNLSSIKSTLTLNVSPANSGKISGETTGASLEVNKVYTVKATAAKGWIFNDWIIGTNVNAVLGSNASLAFIMQSNLVLQANFVTNPFPAVAGVYNGLFSPATGVTEETSGFFTATLASTGSGAYTGKLMVDGGSYSVKGFFDLSGDAQTTIARAGKTPVDVVLHLNLLAPDDQMTGFVVNFASNGWTSPLQADRAVFGKTNVNTNYAGKYTMVISPGSGAPTNAPGGYSYATLSSSSAGLVALSGSLADNTAISQSVPVSKDGNIPLYVSLYAGKGSLMGWLTLTNLTTNQTSPAPMVMGTNLAWIKTNIHNATYPAGFASTNLTATGSLYTNGFSLTNGTLTIGSGDLSVPLVFDGVNVSGAKLTSTNTAIKGTITAATGVLTLTVTQTGSSKITAKGVTLQGSTGTNGAGWFFSGGESGYFLLTK